MRVLAVAEQNLVLISVTEYAWLSQIHPLFTIPPPTPFSLLDSFLLILPSIPFLLLFPAIIAPPPLFLYPRLPSIPFPLIPSLHYSLPPPTLPPTSFTRAGLQLISTAGCICFHCSAPSQQMCINRPSGFVIANKHPVCVCRKHEPLP